jgi:hypothetical protein
LTVIVASLAILAAVLGWRLTTYLKPVPITPGSTTYVPQIGGVKAGHLYLTFQYGTLGQSCIELANELNFPVACPNLLPSDATISGPECCLFSNPRVAPLFVFESHFTATNGYPAAEPVPNESGPHGHFLLTAMRRTPESAALTCVSPEDLGPGPKVLGVPASWQLCPAGSGGSSGHLMLVWEIGGVEYTISLHGDSRDNRLALQLIALNLTLDYPGQF